MKNEIIKFLDHWDVDSIHAKAAFSSYWKYLSELPEVECTFKARPDVSYSLRAAYKGNTSRPLFVMVDVVDDDPEERWLSVCFYADMVNDPEGLGDEVPDGLMGEDACCFNLEEDDSAMRNYIMARLKEAAKAAKTVKA